MTYEAMIREATQNDLLDILNIYNQGIEDRIATLDDTPKSYEEIKQWYQQHSNRYAVLVLTVEGRIRGWASLNPYSHRRAYAGVAELSIYIDRAWRGKGLGTMLIKALEEKAKANGFYKMVLFTFPFNQLGQNLYRKCGFREVGVFKNQGRLDGKWVDVMAMEKLLCEE